jgi:Leucine-rich repeat (LRR) protein
LFALDLKSNQVSDLEPISGLTNLSLVLTLSENDITDLAPLLTNAALGGLGAGDIVTLFDNPLSDYARTNQIPRLENDYGITVDYDEP